MLKKMHKKIENKQPINYLSDNGSASILLVIIMVTLLSLGVLSVVSSYSNYKIASKNANWNVVYYEEDAYYQTKLYELAQLRAEYGTVIDAYISSKSYLKTETDMIPSDLHRMIKGFYETNAQTTNKVLLEADIKNRWIAHMTAQKVGLKSNFEEALKLSEDKLLQYYQMPLKSESQDPDARRLSVVLSIYGEVIKIVEYREVPVKFTYKEMEFTDVEESGQ